MFLLFHILLVTAWHFCKSELVCNEFQLKLQLYTAGGLGIYMVCGKVNLIKHKSENLSRVHSCFSLLCVIASLM